jgi:hypothetical protein
MCQHRELCTSRDSLARFSIFVFFIKHLPLGYCFTPQSVSAYNFKFAEMFEFEVGPAVSMTPLSHGTRSYTKFHCHRLSGVNDTAKFCFSGVTGELATVFKKHILGCESVAKGEMFYENIVRLSL